MIAGLHNLHPAVPATRVATLLRYVDRVRSLGAPVDALLERSAIPAAILGHPTAAVPLDNAFRFGELACRALGTAHLGLDVGLATSLENLGSYGAALRRTITLGDYFREGIALYNLLTTGQRLWLSDHGPELRLNVSREGPPGLGGYQSDLEILTITIAMCRRAAGPRWAPAEISFAFRPRERFPDIEFFAGSRIVRGTGATFLVVPRALMQRAFPDALDTGLSGSERVMATEPIPASLGGLVQLQIESLLSDRLARIEVVAESLNMSGRSLQRRLMEEGLSYSGLVADSRMRRAAAWLRRDEKPVVEIALDLGYTDPSNFTRAFRRWIGMPPAQFRRAARGA